MGEIYLDSFCNYEVDGPFWSSSLTLNTQDPNFTTCFQYTALYWLPMAWLIIAMPFQLHFLALAKTVFPLSEVSKFNKLKQITTLVLIGTAIANIVLYSVEAGDGLNHGLAFVFSPSLLIVVLIYVMIVTHFEYRKGFNTSGTLFVFWFLEFAIFTVQVVSATEHISKDDVTSSKYFYISEARYIVLLIAYVCVVALNFMHIIADNKGVLEILHAKKRGGKYIQDSEFEKERFTNTFLPEKERERKLSPGIFSAFISRVTFFWFTSTTWTGFRRALNFFDLWEVLPEFRSSTLVPKIVNGWEQELDKAVQKQRKEIVKSGAINIDAIGRSNSTILVPDDAKRHSYHVVRSNSATDNLFALRSMHNHPEVKKKIFPSLIGALKNAIGVNFMLCGLMKLSYDALTFLQPVLLSLVISVIIGDNPIDWHGYYIGCLLFASGVLRSFFLQGFYHFGLLSGQDSRTALTGLIYRKALRLSASGKKDSTVGEIVNLMSVDIQRIQDAMPFVNIIWSAPMVVVITIVMLYAEIGDAAFAGLGVLLIMMPLNVILSSRVKKLQVEQMKYKDDRIKLTTEVLNGMKVLKLYGWEQAYRKVIDDIRQCEVKVLKRMALIMSVTATSVFAAPFLVGATCFAVYTASSVYNILTPQIAYVCLSLVAVMNGPLNFFPQVLALTIQGLISMRRIRDFLLSDELMDNCITYDNEAEHPVTISGGTFSWGRDELPFLNEINLVVAKKQLLTIVGSVGSGKSSIVHAILGEMHKVKGQVVMNGRVAYAPQQAWLINATVRENITFGRPYDKQLYDRVIRACALEPDMKIFPNGDETEVGERGINMSGGQKQRISLARAVYQDLDIYVLDDVLSAVDAHVAKHLFDEVLGPNGLLKDKTRILVTHAVNIMPKADHIIVMNGGRIEEDGTFDQLISRGGPFSELIRDFLIEEREEQAEEVAESEKPADPDAKLKAELLRQVSVVSNSSDQPFQRKNSARRSRNQSRAHAESKPEPKTQNAVIEEEVIDKETKLISEESAATGDVKWTVYVAYAKALGLLLSLVASIFYALYVTGGVCTSIWLSIWTSDPVINGTSDPDLTQERIGGYFGIGVFQIFMLFVHVVSFSLASTRASKVMHDMVFSTIVRAPMSFFDSTPLGRIINRLSKDLDTLDIMIPLSMRTWLISMNAVLVTIILIIISNWLLFLIVLPLILLFFVLTRFYIRTSRQIKRIDSVLRSPIFVQFQTSLVGTTSIRAYKLVDRFNGMNDSLVDKSNMTYYPQCVASRWLGVAVDALNNFMLLVITLVSVGISQDSASLASLAVTYTMTLTISLNLMVRSVTDLETYIVSIERLREYAVVESEASPEDREGLVIPDDWPSAGKVQFADYSVRYRAGLDLVLKNINCSINPGERVGIVGRTGAGKSSLSLALFRILEPANGTIYIDDVDITHVGLQKLRDRVTIIPQEPVLFSGTLRMNIDPFKKYSDDAIWQALECSNLKAFVQAQDKGLDFVCAEGGENLSVGQRQLVCMARAVLRRSKILLLDEATAAVDVETDQLIQRTIREEFKNSTILTIAHRLNTVIDYDKIMVLDRGSVKEYDSPTNLLNDHESQFYSMAKNAGLVQDS